LLRDQAHIEQNVLAVGTKHKRLITRNLRAASPAALATDQEADRVQGRVLSLSLPIAVHPDTCLYTWLPTVTYRMVVCRRPDARSFTHKQYGDMDFAAAGPHLWNRLPLNMRHHDLSYEHFLGKLKTQLYGYRKHGVL